MKNVVMQVDDGIQWTVMLFYCLMFICLFLLCCVLLKSNARKIPQPQWIWTIYVEFCHDTGGHKWPYNQIINWKLAKHWPIFFWTNRCIKVLFLIFIFWILFVPEKSIGLVPKSRTFCYCLLFDSFVRLRRDQELKKDRKK